MARKWVASAEIVFATGGRDDIYRSLDAVPAPICRTLWPLGPRLAAATSSGAIVARLNINFNFFCPNRRAIQLNWPRHKSAARELRPPPRPEYSY